MEDEDYRDKARRADAAQREEVARDYGNESAGRETGRIERHLPGEASPRSVARRRQERTRRMMSALERMIRDPVYRAQYEAFGDYLNEAETKTETAFTEAEAALANAQDRLRNTNDGANVLPNGTKVFRAADGQVMDEHGNMVGAEDAAGIIWKDGAPTYEEYLAAKQRAEDAARLVDDFRRYQTDLLGRARDRWEDTDSPITPDEMEEWRERIERDNPVAARSAIAEPGAETELGASSTSTMRKPQM